MLGRAAVEPVRQRTQFTCMATSLAMSMRALGTDVGEDEVNRVLRAAPREGASWQQLIDAATHYGFRVTLVAPATVEQLRSWTARGLPVVIGWNPEGKPWSHASVVFDVDEAGNVYVADPNMPDPTRTVRVLSSAEFYPRWNDREGDSSIARPAAVIEREVGADGVATTSALGLVVTWG